MPYRISEQAGRYCVIKEGDDSPLKCYDTRGEAQDYLAALEANVADAKMVMRPTQTEVGYETLSTHPGEACANCRWFNSMDGMPGCHLIENYPLDILPTGYCNRWESPPPMEAAPEPVPVVIVEEVAMMQVHEDEKAGRMISAANAGALKTAWESVRNGMSALTDLLTKAGLFTDDDDEKVIKEQHSTFKVFKAQDGQYYWKATWSNDFKDRDGEIISSKGHARYLARIDAGLVPLPDLHYWHIPALKHGKALYIRRVERMMQAFGVFDDTPLAKVFIEHYRKNRKKVSHGFTYPTWALKDGVYEDYNTFEISPLPPDVAANLYTGFEEITNMGLTDEQKAHVERILGKDLMDKTFADDAKLSKALEAAGVAFKDFADVPGATELASEGGEALLAQMQLALVTAQGALAQQQDAQAKTFAEKDAAYQTALKALEDKLTALEQKLELTPRSASSSAHTVVDDPTLLKQVQDKTAKYDPQWKALGLEVPLNDNGAT